MAGETRSQIPPAPWTLRGEAVFALRLVRKERVRTLVPPDARIVCVWPGRTLAILYLAHYRESPVGEYHEIIVAPALVRLRGKIGAWISDIRVDSEASVLAGRSIWALPKERASMHWHSTYCRVVASLLKLQVNFAQPRRFMRLPVFGVALSIGEGVANRFAVHGAARVGVTRATVDVTEGTGLQKLGFDGPRRIYICEDMTITIGPPRSD